MDVGVWQRHLDNLIQVDVYRYRSRCWPVVLALDVTAGPAAHVTHDADLRVTEVARLTVSTGPDVPVVGGDCGDVEHVLHCSHSL